MNELQIKLRCTGCRKYRDYQRDQRSDSVVRCTACGKRHSMDSLFAVEEGEEAWPDDT